MKENQQQPKRTPFKFIFQEAPAILDPTPLHEDAHDRKTFRIEQKCPRQWGVAFKNIINSGAGEG